jgi:mRNA interferase RelE/StbE
MYPCDYIFEMKEITYSKQAVRTLRRIPANTARMIVAKVNAYAADPASQANNVRALRGRDGIRLRVGDWRVIMQDGHVLAVLEINPRGGAY